MIVTRYKAGAAVPTDILDVEPLKPGKARPRITFGGDADVIDLGDRIVILSVANRGRGTIECVGQGEVLLFATQKDVLIPTSVHRIGARP